MLAAAFALGFTPSAPLAVEEPAPRRGVPARRVARADAPAVPGVAVAAVVWRRAVVARWRATRAAAARGRRGGSRGYLQGQRGEVIKINSRPTICWI